MQYTLFPHYLSVYQKPKLGPSYLARYQAYNYRHKISAMGGFDTMSCDVLIRDETEGHQILEQFLANRVAVYVDNPHEPVWEGYINRMYFDAGATRYTISLDEMINRATITYTDPATSATNSVITAASDDAASQAIYGIKQGNIDFGYLRGGVGATALRDTILAQRSWPKSSTTKGGGGSGLLHIECNGFYHTLDWEIYSNAATANNTVQTMVTSLLGVEINGATFFNNADVSEVSANATVSINQEHTKRETYWSVYQRALEIGDSSGNYWIAGITPTDPRTGTRRFYYRQFNPVIKYLARKADGLRVRNEYGQLVQPWLVRPDAGIRISDMLVAWEGLGDNPAETYIQTVDYDANAQTVDYRGDDDTTAEGVFQLTRYGKPAGRRFGAARRSV